MKYIQRIVPRDVPMLQLRKDYDVISYRIEHIRTAKNPSPSGEDERKFLGRKVLKVPELGGELPEIPEEYLDKYRLGIKIAPFIRIYRTIAPHSEVKKKLKGNLDKLSIFKNPKQVKDAREEICYSSVGGFYRKWKLSYLFYESFVEKEQKEITKERKREFRKVIAPRLKHKSNKFMRKCLAVDDFFDDVTKYLEDPTDLYRDKLIKRLVKLDYIFEECDALNTELPEGFANETSGLTKQMIVDLLTVIETLKWQVGINKGIDDAVFNTSFKPKDVLWSSNKKNALFYDIEQGYIMKYIAADNNCVYTGDSESVYPLSLKMNPHKIHFILSEYFDKSIIPDDKFMELFGQDIKKTYWTKEKLETDNFTKEILDNIDIGKLDFNKKSDVDILKRKIATFNYEFIEEFLDKNIDKYPQFISERLKNVDEYPGILVYMFDKERRKYSPKEVDPDPLGYGNGSGEECIFNLFEKFDQCSINLIFDLAYLMDYSDTLITAGEAERKGLVVYETLQKIQAVDPKDNIASRFLAELVSKELINKHILLDKWDTLSSHKTFKDTEKEDEPQEARAVKAFKLYRKTMRKLTDAISSASSLDPIVEFDRDPSKLPSLRNMVKTYLLDRILDYSRIPLNKEFSRESTQKDMYILDYIEGQNEEARITRNKFAHGLDINESEFIQFMGFCNKTSRVAENIINIIENKKRKNMEK